MNLLDQLKQYTQVVADTGDFDSMKQYKPVDATTNPSLIYAAAQKEAYARVVERAIEYGVSAGGSKDQKLINAMDMMAVAFGMEILKIVPRRVSTEVDARLSFDTEGSIQKAKKLIGLYEANGIHRDQVLIKVAATWEGVNAARELEKMNRLMPRYWASLSTFRVPFTLVFS